TQPAGRFPLRHSSAKGTTCARPRPRSVRSSSAKAHPATSLPCAGERATRDTEGQLYRSARPVPKAVRVLLYRRSVAQDLNWHPSPPDPRVRIGQRPYRTIDKDIWRRRMPCVAAVERRRIARELVEELEVDELDAIAV